MLSSEPSVDYSEPGQPAATDEVVRTEAVVTEVLLETSADLRPFIEELSQKYRATGGIPFAFVDLFALMGLASFGVVASQLVSNLSGDEEGRWLIGLAAMIAYMGIVFSIDFLYKLALMRRLSTSLQASDLARQFSTSPDGVLRIYDYAKDPWRRLFLQTRPKSTKGIVKLVTTYISWFLKPPKMFVPLGWLPKVLTGLPGIAALIYIFLPVTGYWDYSDSTLPGANPLSHALPIPWLYVVLSVLAILAIIPFSLIQTHESVARIELLAYLRAWVREAEQGYPA
jgi:hypothetical protein